MNRMLLGTVLLLSMSHLSIARADYVTPEELIEISPGVRVRSISAEQIEKFNIKDDVVKLYNQNFEMDKALTLVRGPDNCIVLIINTKNGVKNFINQVILKDDQCFKH